MAKRNKKGNKGRTSKTVKTRGGKKPSTKRALEASNPCCPVIRATTNTATNAVVVHIGKTTKRFKDGKDAGYQAASYIEAAQTAQRAKRCDPLVQHVEYTPSKTSRASNL